MWLLKSCFDFRLRENFFFKMMFRCFVIVAISLDNSFLKASGQIFDQSIRIYFFYIRFRREGYIYIYIYHKNEERHDNAFYILASGAIVLTMVLSSNAICKFTSSPCNHLHHLSMGPNNILPNALLMEPLQHFDKVSTSHLSGN